MRIMLTALLLHMTERKRQRIVLKSSAQLFPSEIPILDVAALPFPPHFPMPPLPLPSLDFQCCFPPHWPVFIQLLFLLYPLTVHWCECRVEGGGKMKRMWLVEKLLSALWQCALPTITTASRCLCRATAAVEGEGAGRC